jgi:hypothetical protein
LQLPLGGILSGRARAAPLSSGLSAIRIATCKAVEMIV